MSLILLGSIAFLIGLAQAFVSGSRQPAATQRGREVSGLWVDGEILKFKDEVSASTASLTRDAHRLTSQANGRYSPPGTAIDQALILLLDGKLTAAAETLRKALGRDPLDGPLLNDLAVIELAMADHGKSEKLISALDTLERCNRAQPSLREAHFNRAVVLKRLSLKTSAREAWLDFLKSKPEVSWKRRAERELISTGGLSFEEAWRTSSPLLQRAADRENGKLVAKLVSQFRQPSRILVQEEVLVRWAYAYRLGNTIVAAKQLAIARQISRALVQVNGEWSAADAIGEVERAEKRGMGKVLAEGYINFWQGLKAYQALQPQEALMSLGKAQGVFRTTICPSLLLWTDLWLAGSKYYLGQRQAAEAEINEVLSSARIFRYPALRGRALWSSGLMALVRSDFSHSLRSYQAALENFQRIGELENTGAVQALLAENLHVLGKEDQSWRMRVLALEILHSFPSSVRLHNLLSEAADQLVSAGRPAVAQYFHTEDIQVAGRIGNPATVAEALLGRGRDFFALGHTDKSWADMREVRSWIEEVPDTATRDKLKAEASLVAGELVDVHMAQEVIGDLASAVVYYEAADIPALASLASLMRAKALLLLNQDEEACIDLKKAIDVHESATPSIGSVEDQVAYREQWQAAFDQFIEIEAIQRKNPQGALDLLEYSRSGHWVKDVSVAIFPKLRGNDVLIEYALLPEKVLIWVVTNKSVGFATVTLDARRLESMVGKVVDKLRESSLGEQAMVRTLTDILVKPVVDRVPSATVWYIIADPIIGSVPFASLLDPVSGSYLVEGRTLIYEPSMQPVEAMRLSRRDSNGNVGAWPLLAIGNPTLDASLYPGAEVLPGSELEAREVAGMYKTSTILVGSNASRENFLLAVKRAKIVHVAGHASYGEGLESPEIFLAPSGHGSVPYISAGDLARMDLRTVKLFVLSACETAPKESAIEEVHLDLWMRCFEPAWLV